VVWLFENNKRVAHFRISEVRWSGVCICFVLRTFFSFRPLSFLDPGCHAEYVCFCVYASYSPVSITGQYRSETEIGFQRFQHWLRPVLPGVYLDGGSHFNI